MRLNAAFSRTWGIVASIIAAVAGLGHDVLEKAIGEQLTGVVLIVSVVIVAASRATTEPAAPTRQALFHDADSSTNPLK